jgi:glycosyltransferase involved in cell wall biosynthesis
LKTPRNDKCRILLVIRWPVGGIRTFLRYFYGSLDPKQYELSIVLPVYAEQQALAEDLQAFQPSYTFVPSSHNHFDFARSVLSVLLRKRVDVVHSQGLSAAFYASASALITRTPHIVTVHETFNCSQFAGWKGALKQRVADYVLSSCSLVHCISHDLRENVAQFFPRMARKIDRLVVVRHGVQVQRFRGGEVRNLRQELGLPSESFLLGFLGRFMPEKGFRVLAQAMKLILAEHSPPRPPILLAFGQGGFIREEKAWVEANGLVDHILFMPFVPNIASTLKGLDVVVMPSFAEACGLLAMEALVAGAPVIGSNCIGLREVLADTPATLVPTDDARALASALLHHMRHPAQDAAKTFAPIAAERFDVATQAMQLERAMRAVCRNPGRRPTSRSVLE